MDVRKLKKQILDILKEINPYEEIDENSLLIEEGIIDSLSFFVLISELENKFQIHIPEDRLQLEQFENIGKIEELVSDLL